MHPFLFSRCQAASWKLALNGMALSASANEEGAPSRISGRSNDKRKQLRPRVLEAPVHAVISLQSRKFFVGGHNGASMYAYFC